MAVVTATNSRRLRVDWTLPAWGILGLLMQVGAFVWFAATLTAHVDENREHTNKLETRVTAVETTVGQLVPQVAVLNERTTGLAK